MSAQWLCKLSGAFKPYDRSVSDSIEAAYQRGEAEVKVQLNGSWYVIHFGEMKQKQWGNPSRTRPVQRQLSAPPAASPLPSPTPPAAPPLPSPTPPAAAPLPSPTPPAAAPLPSPTPPAAAPLPSPAPPAAAPLPSPAPPAAAPLPSPTPPAAPPLPSPTPPAASPPPPPAGNNAKIHAMLVEFAEWEKARGDTARAGSYYKAARSVEQHSAEIRSGKEAKQLSGLGLKMAAKVDELLSTGEVASLKRRREEPRNEAMKALQRVWGIGPSRAKQLYEEHGIATLSMLSASPSVMREEERAALRYVHDFEAPIPRDEVGELFALLERAANAHCPPLLATLCGSHRRGAPSSDAIHVVLTQAEGNAEGNAEGTISAAPPLAALAAALERQGFLSALLSLDQSVCVAACRRRTAAPTMPPAAAPQPLVADWKAIAARAKLLKQGSSKANLFDSWREEKARRQASSGASSMADPVEARGEVATSSCGGSSSSAAEPKGPAGFGDGLLGVGEDLSAGAGAGAGLVEEERHRRIELRLVPYDSYHYATLFFTGSEAFHRSMRAAASERGYTLTEYSLSRADDSKQVDLPEKVTCEEDIFRLIGMKYVPPTERNL
ncbi:hypothetical protein AB1Y20_020910 [Prymnesium parvum]|uniref:DNA polymerase n=1 Tax=Prymnesium parvum TaxID=97485 RepID=A0AB34JI53_PRYPA